MSRLTDKERYFRDFAIWPAHVKFDTEGWMENFLGGEVEAAERLLATFSYFNEQMTDALFRGALQNYMSGIDRLANAVGHVRDIDLNSVGFVLCEGEEPHPTDSAHIFARKLRDIFGIPETSIFTPNALLAVTHRIKHVILFDDFAGSGNQFMDTIERNHQGTFQFSKLADLTQSKAHRVAYCPCVCTTRARDKITKKYPNIALAPAHILGEEANVSLPTARAWLGLSPNDAVHSISMIKAASARAGFDHEDGSQEDWRGFHGLGHTLAFSHGIPDASLPIFYSTRKNWKPLIRRAA